jgi:hypothetical protein
MLKMLCNIKLLYGHILIIVCCIKINGDGIQYEPIWLNDKIICQNPVKILSEYFSWIT